MSDVDLEPFFAAAREGRGDAVLQAVGRQPLLLEARDPHNGGTALHSLARLSAAPAVAKLIAAGADVEARDRNFCSPLHLAARADASVAGADAAGRDGAIIETLRALLKGGARVGARDSFGLTALHHAAQAGHPPACDFLLSLNTKLRQPRAPIEADTNAEERPLHLAAAGGHADVVCRHGGAQLSASGLTAVAFVGPLSARARRPPRQDKLPRRDSAAPRGARRRRAATPRRAAHPLRGCLEGGPARARLRGCERRLFTRPRL